MHINAIEAEQGHTECILLRSLYFFLCITLPHSNIYAYNSYIQLVLEAADEYNDIALLFASKHRTKRLIQNILKKNDYNAGICDSRRCAILRHMIKWKLTYAMLLHAHVGQMNVHVVQLGYARIVFHCAEATKAQLKQIRFQWSKRSHQHVQT